jgi:hypothetical protein
MQGQDRQRWRKRPDHALAAKRTVKKAKSSGSSGNNPLVRELLLLGS